MTDTALPHHHTTPAGPHPRPRRERFAQFTVRGVIAAVSVPRPTRKGTASAIVTVELDNKRQLPLLLLDHDVPTLHARIQQHGLAPGVTIRAQGAFIPALDRTETDRFIIDRNELIVIHTPPGSLNGS